MKKTATLLLLLTAQLSFAQVIWSENFNSYANGTTTGANNNTANPSADWTAVCPGSVAATDYYYVRNGLLEGRDTNGPATWESESIDISGLPAGVEVTIDLSEVGNLEGCNICGNSCNCTDWILIATSIDGGPFTRYTSPAGGTCLQAGCTDGDYVTLDDFTSLSFNSGCLYGNTLQIRVAVQTWAGSEYLQVDNVAVTANATNCGLLPIDLQHFDARDDGLAVQTEWSVPTVHRAQSFVVERSADGVAFQPIGSVPATPGQTHYQWADAQPLGGTSYYRLQAVDLDGEATYSPLRALTRPTSSAALAVFPNPTQDRVHVRLPEGAATANWTVELLDWSGRVVVQSVVAEYETGVFSTRGLPTGTYLVVVQAGGLVWRERLVVRG